MTTPTKCYVVSTTDCDDYVIKAIFIDRADAEAYHADLVKTDENPNDIDKWEFGRPDDSIPRESWTVYIFLSTGKEKFDSLIHGFCMASPSTQSSHAESSDYFDIAYATSFVSRDHAHKLAVEKRQEWLRERDLKLAEARKREESVARGELGVDFEQLEKVGAP